MGLLDWFNLKETDTTTFEVSNDDGDQIVFTVPTKGSNKIRKALRDAHIYRDTDEQDYRGYTVTSRPVQRDSTQWRWWAQRDVDDKEDIEWQGDHEHGCTDQDDDTEGCDPYADDEESEQTALRFWPRW
ncbi:MAG: hypothetical protein AAGA83_25740 [Cyanobacteria bacterium P01_F01_bin.116]